MNLKKYFVAALTIFIIGLLWLYAGLNHPSGNKPPLLEQNHSMHKGSAK